MKILLGRITLELKRRKPFLKLTIDNKWYFTDYQRFCQLSKNNTEFPILKNYPCLDDKNDECGNIRNPYFFQDFYVAEKIFKNSPQKHVDIGSRIDGFVAHVALFRTIEVFDIRPMLINVPNIIFKQADLTDPQSIPTDYCDSISCLHALEHFGLGRYGDKIDPDGHLKGFEQITKILKPGGIFYFSVPMGVQRIEFNAHRIFGMPYLMNWVTKDYNIVSFAYIDDKCILHEKVELTDGNIASSFGCNHGCAIFELKKKSQ